MKIKLCETCKQRLRTVEQTELYSPDIIHLVKIKEKYNLSHEQLRVALSISKRSYYRWVSPEGSQIKIKQIYFEILAAKGFTL